MSVSGKFTGLTLPPQKKNNNIYIYKNKKNHCVIACYHPFINNFYFLFFLTHMYCPGHAGVKGNGGGDILWGAGRGIGEGGGQSNHHH